MFKFVIVAVAVGSALAFGSAAYGQSAPHPRHSKTAPAAVEDPDVPKEVTAVPQNVQKWIGGAVDDILTGADKAIDPAAGKR